MSDRARPPADIAPADFFTHWAPNAVRTDPERGKKLENLRAKIQFNLAGEGGGLFWLDVGDGDVRGGEGAIESPELTLLTDVGTWRDLNAGQIKAPTAVMKGKLRFQGSMYLALRIHFIIG